MIEFWFNNFFNRKMFHMYITPSVSLIRFDSKWTSISISWITFTIGIDFKRKKALNIVDDDKLDDDAF